MVSMWLPPDVKDMTALTDRKLRLRMRASTDVDTVVLHQMGFSRGNVPERYLNVVSHFAVLPDGTILKLHPMEAFLAASSDLNTYSVAVEFAGNFPNEKGYYWAGNAGRHILGEKQISAGRELLRWMYQDLGIVFINAHRQGELASERGNCPGPDIWYHLGEWAVKDLGMDDGGKDFKEGRGSPIPESWRRPRT